MKAVILTGRRGAGERIDIGGKPIAWHVMRRLARFGVTDFVVCGEPVPAAAVEAGWRVVTMPGASLKQAEQYIHDDRFLLADDRGLADFDLSSLVAFGRSQGRLATVTAVRLRDEYVSAGVFMLRRGVFDYLAADDELEHEPIVALAHDGELVAFRHEGFWQPTASDHDRVRLNELWATGRAPWAA